MRSQLIASLAAAALLLSAPAFAHGGHGHGKSGHGHWKHGHSHWKPVRHRHVHERVVVREFAQPVYPRAVFPVYAAPAPGIHVVIPGIYIPFP